MNVESLGPQLGSQQPWEEQADGWWLVEPALDVKRMAALLVDQKARLVTITARPAPGGECRLVYHWDWGGTLVNLVTTTHEGSIDSIASLCPAADWIEREIHDYFAVDFIGRADGLEPLVLRPGDSAGLFQWDGQEGQEGGAQ